MSMFFFFSSSITINDSFHTKQILVQHPDPWQRLSVAQPPGHRVASPSRVGADCCGGDGEIEKIHHPCLESGNISYPGDREAERPVLLLLRGPLEEAGAGLPHVLLLSQVCHKSITSLPHVLELSQGHVELLAVQGVLRKLRRPSRSLRACQVE